MTGPRLGGGARSPRPEPWRRTIRSVLGVVVLSGTLAAIAGAGSPSAIAGASPSAGVLASGATLSLGQSITSPNGQFRLVLQGDGNLVEFDGSSPAWAAGTNPNGASAVMQGDGNFVVYNASNTPLFASDTSGNPGADLVLSDNGSLEVVSSSGSVLWGVPNVLVPNTTLPLGQSVTSPNGQFKLTLQGDGNLVEFDGSTPAWGAGTNPGGSLAVMQGDGNLVVYNSANAPLFATNTSGNPGADLVLSDGGTLEVLSSSGSVLWGEPDVLVGGKSLAPGQSITSPNGQFRLALQNDGNLVEFDGSSPAWAAGTNPGGTSAVMQGDGNLVVYNASHAPLFASDTSGNPGADLVLADTGTLAVESASGTVLWGEPDVLVGGKSLTAGQSITSPNGQFRLALQNDGNLVEFDGSSPAWAASTNPNGASAVMQGDGNFVVYDSSHHPLFASDTSGNPGADLVLADNGSLEVDAPGGAQLWVANSPSAPNVTTPVIGSVTATGLGVTVGWSPDGTTTGVVSYSVTLSPARGTPPSCAAVTATTPASNSSLNVEGLCAGQVYTATVAATNGSGTGWASEPSNPVVPLVAQVPTAPLVTNVVARTQSLVVAWSPPTLDGGDPVTGYTLTALVGSSLVATATPSASATTATLSGLTNGTAYTLSLVATNAVGPSSSAGATGTPQAAYVPGAPGGFTAQPGTDGSSVILSWSAPSDDGGSSITGYAITELEVVPTSAGDSWQPAPGATPTVLSAGAGATSLTVSGISPADAYYQFSIAAQNGVGIGAAAVANPVTPIVASNASTVVLTTATMAALGSFTANVLTWPAPGPSQVQGLVVGDILVSGPSTNTPDGLLDTVDAINQPSPGTYALTVAPASLTGAFSDLSLSSTSDPLAASPASAPVARSLPTASARFVPASAGVRVVTPSNTNSSSAAGITFSKSISLAVNLDPGDGAFVTGQVSLTPSLTLAATLNHGFAGIPDGANLSASASVTASASLSAGLKGSTSKKLGEIDGEPIDIQIGPVPVVIVPKVPIFLDASGQIGVTSSVSITIGATMSWSSRNSGTLNVANTSTPLTFTGGGPYPGLAETGSASLSLQEQPQLDFYDVAGPNFEADENLDATMNVSGSPFLTISPTLALKAGLDVDLFDVHRSLEVTIGTFHFPDLTIQNPPNASYVLSPANSVVGQGNPVTFTATRSTQASQPLTWSLIGATSADSITSSGVLSVGGHPGRTLRVLVSDPTGAEGLTTVTVGSAFDPPGNVNATWNSTGAGATLTWSPPNNTGGSAITGYVIATQPATTIVRVGPGTTSAALPGLSSTSNYVISIYATNAEGRQSPVATTTIGKAPPGAVSIVGDANTFCALLTSSGVDCWGNGTSGQLGDGSLASSDVPVAVSGLAGVASLYSDGGDTFCALLTAGVVDCWGYGHEGELGNGQFANSDVPVPVLTDVASLSTDGNAFCALVTTGEVSCWGHGESGQLGDGSTANSGVPVAVSGLTGVASLYPEINEETFCALLTSGGVDCWGNGTSGQLGDGSFASSDVPVAVSGLNEVAGLYPDITGATICALLTSGGGVDCWGYGGFGQLGDGSFASSDVPVAVSDLSGAARLYYGYQTFCALLTTGEVHCWGDGRAGELGDGSFASSDVPVAVSGLSRVTSLYGDHFGDVFCALVNSGEVDCWGYGGDDELGAGSTANSNVPMAASGLGGAVSLYPSGLYALCAILTSGGVDCWGLGISGELGDGSEYSDVPMPVIGLTGVASLYSAGSTVCAVLTTGGVDCWGSGESGQLGDGAPLDSNGNYPSSGVPVIVEGIGP